MEEVKNIRTHPAQYLFHLMFTGIFIGHGTLLSVRLYERALYLENKSAQDKDVSSDTLYWGGGHNINIFVSYKQLLQWPKNTQK